jgi:hypothetical protein
MKEQMKNYFEQLINVWKGFNNSLPKVPWNVDAKPLIYEGEIDEDEYICWKPVEKDIVHDLKNIESDVQTTLHESLKKYFNSYWFAELAGFYKSYNIILEPVIPGIELQSFWIQLKGYKEAHGGSLVNIPIGIEGRNSLLIVVDNINGKVKIEDYETGKFEEIADSLENLISDLKMKEGF